MNVDLKIENYQQARQVLEQLPTVVQKRMFVTSLRKASAPIVKSARAKAPKKSGAMARSIRAVRAKYGRKHETALLILPVFEVYKKSNVVNAYYGNMVHFGTVERKTKKPVVATLGGKTVNLGIYRGRVAPRPFLLDAFNETRQRMIDGFGDTMAVELTKFARKNFKTVP